MGEETTYDFEGPSGPVEGAGLDTTANTAGVLRDDLRAAYAAIDGGNEDATARIDDRSVAALERSLRDRPEIARYLASKTRSHREGSPPEDVDELFAALIRIGLETTAPEFATVLEESAVDEE